MAVPKVFVSMGTPYTEEYARFREELETFLRDQCHVDPRIIGKNEYPTGSPLAKIREVMRGCNGVIIVAYERKFVAKGSEKRGSPSSTALANRAYTTPWNHIESAMAFSLQLPIHIICQEGLAEEGLIETKVDWYVQRIGIKPGAFQNPQVSESIRNWVAERVMPHAKRRPSLAKILLGNARFSEMTPAEVYAAIGLIVGVFLAGTGAGLFLHSLFTAPAAVP